MDLKLFCFVASSGFQASDLNLLINIHLTELYRQKFNSLYQIVIFVIYNCREISQKGKELLLIQCDTGDENSSLVECARHCVQRELQSNASDLCVVFLVHLSRVSESLFSGFQVSIQSAHVHSQD